MFGRYNNQGWNHQRIGKLQSTLKVNGIRTLILPQIPSAGLETTRISQRREFAKDRKYFPNPNFDVRNSLVSAGVVFGNRGEAVGMLSHWPIAIIRFRSGRVVVVVCNEHTLLNRAIITGAVSGKSAFASAIHAAMHTTRTSSELRGVRVSVIMRNSDANKMYPWDDPLDGKYNRLMTQYVAEKFGTDCFSCRLLDGGVLNLDILIWRQLRMWGASSEYIKLDSLNLAEPNLEEDEDSRWCTNLDGKDNLNFAVVAIP
jgi:hypothetical protein